LADCETCQRANDLAHAGKLWAKFAKESDLELHLRRATLLGTELLLVQDFVPSESRYQPGLIVERRHLHQLLSELVGLERFLAGRSSRQGRLF
jgi:hypothetical protein